jgi:hypothetical protein
VAGGWGHFTGADVCWWPRHAPGEEAERTRGEAEGDRGRSAGDWRQRARARADSDHTDGTDDDDDGDDDGAGAAELILSHLGTRRAGPGGGAGAADDVGGGALKATARPGTFEATPKAELTSILLGE